MPKKKTTKKKVTRKKAVKKKPAKKSVTKKTTNRSASKKVLTKGIAEGYLQDPRSCVLWDYTKLEDDAAEILSSSKSYLPLCSLRTLSSRSAEFLGQHVGALNLNGLTVLSDAAAAGLGGHEHEIRLNGLTNLTVEAVEHLSPCRSLELDGLSCISKGAAAALCEKITVRYRFGQTGVLANKSTKILGFRSLKGITRLDEGVAELFAKTIAKAAKYGGGLDLRLREYPSTTSHLALATTILKNRYAGQTTWEFERLEDLTPELAATLAKTATHVVLDGVESVTLDVARVLCEHKKGVLRLGVKRMDPEAAGLIAKHGPKLFMPRLESLENTKQHRRLLKKLIRSFYTYGQAHGWGGNRLGLKTLQLWAAEEINNASRRNALDCLNFTQLEEIKSDAFQTLLNVGRGGGLAFNRLAKLPENAFQQARGSSVDLYLVNDCVWEDNTRGVTCINCNAYQKRASLRCCDA